MQAAFARDERVGVPRVRPSRTSLCAPDVPRAIDAACTPHRAGGYGYVISASGRHQILETSATRAELSGEAAHAVHTNPTDSATILGFACDLEAGAVCVSDGDPKTGRWMEVAVSDYRHE